MPPKSKDNGTVPELADPRFTLTVDGIQLNMIHQFCTQAQFPTVELKRAAAALQEQLESLVPTEA